MESLLVRKSVILTLQPACDTVECIFPDSLLWDVDDNVYAFVYNAVYDGHTAAKLFYDKQWLDATL